jgi:hypothetical protein
MEDSRSPKLLKKMPLLFALGFRKGVPVGYCGVSYGSRYTVTTRSHQPFSCTLWTKEGAVHHEMNSDTCGIAQCNRPYPF